MADKDREFLDAIEDGRHDDVIVLLRNGACVSACKPETGDSALMIACEKGFPNIVKILLEHNADITIHNSTGACAVHSAVSRDNVEAIEDLYEHGADVNSVDLHGVAPLQMAVNKGFIRSTKMLLRYGADADVCERGFQRAALHDAVRNRDFRTAQMLLERDASVNIQDVSGVTPLHEAVADNNLHMARLLLKYGADINQREHIGGLTPLRAARSRDMRQLLTLFAQRASHDSSRSSDVDSGTQSLHGSHDNILGDAHSLQGSRESLFSLPPIKLNENLPYDADTDRKLIRRIRSRSVEKPVLVEFSSSRSRKSNSFERDSNQIDVLDKTQYIARGRRNRTRHRVPLTPHRAHSLESVYDITKGSLRGYRFSWSPNRGRSRSNSHEKHLTPRQYTEPPLTLYQSKLRREFVQNTDYLEPELVGLDVRVVVSPKHGASTQTDYNSDGESGISLNASGHSPEKEHYNPPRRPILRDSIEFRRSTAHSNSSTHPSSAVGTHPVERIASRPSADYDVPHVHGSHQSDVATPALYSTLRADATPALYSTGGADATPASDYESTDDDTLETYEEELSTKKRPVRIYSSIEDLSVVTSDGKGIALKEDELDAAGRKRVSRYIEHKITKMHKHGHAHRKTSEDLTRDSDRSDFLVDETSDASPALSPILRHISRMSDDVNHSTETQLSSTPRESNDRHTSQPTDRQSTHQTDGPQTQQPDRETTHQTERYTTNQPDRHSTPKPNRPQTQQMHGFDAIETNRHTVNTSDASRPPLTLGETMRKKAEGFVTRDTNQASADRPGMPQVHKTAEKSPGKTEPMRADSTTTHEHALTREDTVDTSSYMQTMDTIRKRFEEANVFIPKTGNITNTLHVSTIGTTGGYEAVELPGDDAHSGQHAHAQHPPMLFKQDSFEVPEGGPEMTSDLPVVVSDRQTEQGASYLRKHESAPIHGSGALMQDSGAPTHDRDAPIQDSDAPTQDSDAPIQDSDAHTQDSDAPMHDSRIDSESEMSQDDYAASLHTSIRGQVHLQPQLSPGATRRKRGSFTPVGAVVRRELEIGRSDSELEDDISERTQTNDVILTHYDVTAPFTTHQKTTVDSDQDKLSSDETLTSGSDESFNEHEPGVGTNGGVDTIGHTLHDRMQSKAGSSFQLGMAPAGEAHSSQVKRSTIHVSTKPDTDTTESELSDSERAGAHGNRPVQGRASRVSGASSPEPEWDRTYTYDDDALLTGQARKSRKAKAKSVKKQSTKAVGATEEPIATPEESNELKHAQENTHSGLEPEVVSQETDALSTHAQDDAVNGADRLAAPSYGAFDMYDKPPEQLSESSETKESSFWGRVCGCCYSFGLY